MFDWLSHDPAEVDAYIADPLCGFDASVALWIDIFHMIRRGANNRNFASIPKHLPFHLIGGAEDPATAGERQSSDWQSGCGEWASTA